MSTVCYCGRAECAATDFVVNHCFADALKRLDEANKNINELNKHIILADARIRELEGSINKLEAALNKIAKLDRFDLEVLTSSPGQNAGVVRAKQIATAAIKEVFGE